MPPRPPPVPRLSDLIGTTPQVVGTSLHREDGDIQQQQQQPPIEEIIIIIIIAMLLLILQGRGRTFGGTPTIDKTDIIDNNIQGHTALVLYG
mmetsp:Transcript_41557/g.66823  ORF Transcript_41557/g.66823 Transcript_41557/m.66823 type:complete len:92 (+) Transcript_41557:683-958(+)